MNPFGAGRPVGHAGDEPKDKPPTAPTLGGRSRLDPRLLAAGAVAVVAVFALARGGGSAAAVPTADTSATDLASGLSDLGGGLADVSARMDDLASGISNGTTAQDHLAQRDIVHHTTPPTQPPKHPRQPDRDQPRRTKPTTAKVKKGDTLTAIARRAGISPDRLRKLNPGLFNRAHKGGNLIHPGETVRLR